MRVDKSMGFLTSLAMYYEFTLIIRTVTISRIQASFLFILFLGKTCPMNAQTKSTEPLDAKQQRIVTISALTTTGDSMTLNNRAHNGVRSNTDTTEQA